MPIDTRSSEELEAEQYRLLAVMAAARRLYWKAARELSARQQWFRDLAAAVEPNRHLLRSLDEEIEVLVDRVDAAADRFYTVQDMAAAVGACDGTEILL